MRAWPKIHTSQWHELHMIFNSRAALHTLSIIAAANGATNICGNCGDPENVHDYMAWAEENTTIPEFPVRLCDDCMQIQSNWGVVFRKPEEGEIEE